MKNKNKKIKLKKNEITKNKKTQGETKDVWENLWPLLRYRVFLLRESRIASYSPTKIGERLFGGAPPKAAGACVSACWAGPQTRSQKVVLLREKTSKNKAP